MMLVAAAMMAATSLQTQTERSDEFRASTLGRVHMRLGFWPKARAVRFISSCSSILVYCLFSMRTPVRISGAAGAVCRPISSGLSRRSPVVAGRPGPCASAHLSRRE